MWLQTNENESGERIYIKMDQMVLTRTFTSILQLKGIKDLDQKGYLTLMKKKMAKFRRYLYIYDRVKPNQKG